MSEDNREQRKRVGATKQRPGWSSGPQHPVPLKASTALATAASSAAAASTEEDPIVLVGMGPSSLHHRGLWLLSHRVIHSHHCCTSGKEAAVVVPWGEGCQHLPNLSALDYRATVAPPSPALQTSAPRPICIHPCSRLQLHGCSTHAHTSQTRANTTAEQPASWAQVLLLPCVCPCLRLCLHSHFVRASFHISLSLQGNLYTSPWNCCHMAGTGTLVPGSTTAPQVSASWTWHQEESPPQLHITYPIGRKRDQLVQPTFPAAADNCSLGH